MATFPQLKTGAVAQYPAAKVTRFRNQALRFLDGSEQRYRDATSPLQEWSIRLSALDEAEMAALEAFFVANQGCLGTFTFIDPWNNSEYANCSFRTDEVTMVAMAEMSGKTTLTIRQNRS